jgi:hypothetical protein
MADAKKITGKTTCDFCMDEPENGVLFEKPGTAIVKGKVYLSFSAQPLYICLDCLRFEAENTF